jgi:bacterioferritin
MFEKLAHGIPLEEAAAFFIKLRTFDKTAEELAPPDQTGTLEGQFAAPVERVLEQMAHHVQNELKTNFAYMVYAHSLRDLSHNAIADQFEEHAHDETDHADWLMRRMGVLGGPVNLPDIPAPPASTDPHDIIQKMIRMEQEGIESWRALRTLVGDDNPMKFKIEEYLTSEQEHLDELWQLLPHEANPALLMQPSGSTTPTSSEVPAVPPSAPDTSPSPPDHKTASVQIERFHPDTFRYHGEAMKLALAKGVRGTVFVPSIGLDGEYKTAAKAKVKVSEMPSLPATGMGMQSPPPPAPPALAGSSAGSNAVKLGEGSFIGYKDPYGAQYGLHGKDPLVEEAAKQLRTRAHVEALQGKINRNPDIKDALLAQHVQEAERSGALGGMIGGGILGAAGGGALGYAAGRGPVSAAMGAFAGGAGGGMLGHHGGGKSGKKRGEEEVDRAFADKLASAFLKMAKEDSEQVEAGRSRALANLASGFTSDKHTRGEQAGDLIGRLAGVVGGGAMGHLLAAGGGKAVSTASTIGGAALGQHLGGRVGRAAGSSMDARNFEEKYGSAFKLALESVSPAGGAPALGGGGAEEAPPEEEGVPQQQPQVDPAFQQYMQQEQEGMAVEKQQEETFYKQKFDAANQQLQAANQQMAQLQQQADQTGEMQQQTMAQAQQIQQAAMQNAQASHQAATQAMQQSLQAQSESTEQAQLAIGMRDSVHAMRHSLLQMVQQELPPATPAESQAVQVDQQAAATGMQPGAPGAPPGQDNTQQPGPDGAPQDPNQAGQPGASPDAGTPPASATPGDGSGAGTSPSAGAGATPTMEGAQPQSEQGMQQQPPKVASAHDGLIGAIMGGAAGAGLGAVGSQMSNDPLRAKVKKLDEADKAGGGFVNALLLAQAKARLAVGEFEERHPVAGTALSAGAGASVGARLAPHARTIFGG